MRDQYRYDFACPPAARSNSADTQRADAVQGDCHRTANPGSATIPSIHSRGTRRGARAHKMGGSRDSLPQRTRPVQRPRQASRPPAQSDGMRTGDRRNRLLLPDNLPILRRITGNADNALRALRNHDNGAGGSHDLSGPQLRREPPLELKPRRRRPVPCRASPPSRAEDSGQGHRSGPDTSTTARAVTARWFVKCRYGRQNSLAAGGGSKTALAIQRSPTWRQASNTSMRPSRTLACTGQRAGAGVGRIPTPWTSSSGTPAARPLVINAICSECGLSCRAISVLPCSRRLPQLSEVMGHYLR